MGHYNVGFFRDLLSSDGHTFKCVQWTIAVDAESPDTAIDAARRRLVQSCGIGDCRLYAEAVESETTPPFMVKAIQRPVSPRI